MYNALIDSVIIDTALATRTSNTINNDMIKIKKNQYSYLN